MGFLTYQTLPVLGGQQFWPHLRPVTLVLLASCPPDTPHTRVVPKWAESFPQIFTAHCTHLDCNRFPYWRVSLPASSTLHKLAPPIVCGPGIKEWVFTLWEHNCWHLMSIAEVPGKILTASLCIEVVNYGNKPWHCWIPHAHFSKDWKSAAYWRP